MSQMQHSAPSAPARIAGEILAAVSALTQVRRVALFGSLAADRSDCWSDVDMMVACEDVAANEWAVAKTIMLAKPVLYYRKFSTMDEPSGRYWFVGESPFNRLDVSFLSLDVYESYLNDPVLYGHNLRLREVYTAGSSPSDMPIHPTARFLDPATDQETQIGTYVYFTLEALKMHSRGRELTGRKLSGIEGLRATIPTLPRHTQMAGGRIGELAYIAYDLLCASGLTSQQS